MYLNSIKQSKENLRSYFKKIRSNIKNREKIKLDLAIQTRLLNARQYLESTKIFTYISKKSEINTTLIIKDALLNRKIVAVPKCGKEDSDMDFYKIYSLNDLKPGAFGVLEPIPERCQLITNLSNGLCIVPGLGFDIRGFRLGYGKGYYDRFLAKFGGITMGLCYSNCVISKLPRNLFDKQIKFLVTEHYFKKA
ncbi:MAG: 5-formyltetrahydrofolate cyclo-ligase [Oscillospiraceae bacterium]|jgi:5-formyltetrahydrofolate cyclo-ligase|nr:5-formyltetrahydrofolate cyclo-ligase [Oscillospiraceae bacterium]